VNPLVPSDGRVPLKCEKGFIRRASFWSARAAAPLSGAVSTAHDSPFRTLHRVVRGEDAGKHSRGTVKFAFDPKQGLILVAAELFGSASSAVLRLALNSSLAF
jgi:hypothetical protein